MRSPGDYSLADLAITAALNAVAQTPVQSLEGMLAATILARFLRLGRHVGKGLRPSNARRWADMD